MFLGSFKQELEDLAILKEGKENGHPLKGRASKFYSLQGRRKMLLTRNFPFL